MSERKKKPTMEEIMLAKWAAEERSAIIVGIASILISLGAILIIYALFIY